MATLVQSTGLNHIAEGQIDSKVFQQHCVEWSVWVLKISACIDVSAPSASVEVFLSGSRVGACVLDAQHPNCLIGGSIDGFKCEVQLNIVDGCTLQVQAEVCAPIIGCKKWNHTLFDWC